MKYKEPYRKEFLECAKEGIKKYSEVKSYNKEIIEISVNVICYSYSSSSMTGSVDDIKLKFFDGSEKSIGVNFGINLYQP